MAGSDFRTRERIVLFAGAAAIAWIGLSAIAAISGNSLGSAAEKLGSVLVAFYLCARIAAHALTLQERGASERLARAAALLSPVLLLVALVQTLRTSAPHLTLGGPSPGVDLGLWLRLELTTDVALFVLFLVTCMAVWIEESTGVSASLTRVSYVVVTLLGLVLLALVWGTVDVHLGVVRLVASLFVLSLVGWLLVAILRRIERLDEPPPGPPAPSPAAPAPPAPLRTFTPQP